MDMYESVYVCVDVCVTVYERECVCVSEGGRVCGWMSVTWGDHMYGPCRIQTYTQLLLGRTTPHIRRTDANGLRYRPEL